MRSILLLLSTMLVSMLATAQQIVQAEYFIGNDPGPGNGIPISIAADNTVLINSSLSTAALSIGFNSIALRTKGASGLWSNTSKRSFFVEASSIGGNLLYHEITAAEYFVDVDPGPGQGTPIDITTGVEVDFAGNVLANLAPGFHKIAVRTLATSGLWSGTKSRHFVVQAPHPGGNVTYHEINAAEYFIDNDPGVGAGTSINLNQGTTVTLVDSLMANLPTGVHKLSVRTRSTSGIWSSTSARMFIVKTGGIANFFEIVAAEYFIDTDPGEGLGIPVTITPGTAVIAEGTVITDGLALGVHSMGIRFKGSTGIWCAAQTAEFQMVELVPFTFTVSLNSPSCAESIDGSIDLNVTSDPTQFTYTWNGNSGAPSLAPITAGEYQLQVDDLFGSTVLDTLFTLTGPEPIVIYSTVTDVLCAGETSGQVDAAAFGGTNPFVYDWNGANFEALAAGTYTLNVTDANGCTASENFDVSEPQMLMLNLVGTTPVTNEVNCNGAIEVTASGGTPDYSIVWNDPAAQSTLAPSNLCAGTYEATLTDDNGCVATLTVDLLPSVVDEQIERIIELQAMPNPTSGKWILQFDLINAQRIDMDVTDAGGRVILKEQNIALPSGRSQRSYDWSAMAAGHYLVRVYTDTQMQSMRISIAP